jgi:RNA polymerase sigma factor (sigma-70 family)
MTPPAANVIRFLQSALGPSGDGPTDADLLARFANTKDEVAFELLVRRHAGMVLRVCRSILKDHHNAEDVGQAVFLALAQQAAIVGRRGAVAGWLYRVAWRIAAKVARRPAPQTRSDLDQIPTRDCEPVSDPALTAILHEELARLPENYRVPLLLCFFEGLTHTEAAQRLGWPIGTLAGRVARAKGCLLQRLSRRGVTSQSVALLALTATKPAPEFVVNTVRAAVAFAGRKSVIPGVSQGVVHLAQGAIQTMTMSKFRWATGILIACGAIVVGGAWSASQGPGAAPVTPPVSGARADADTGAPPPQKSEPDERRADSAQRQKSLNNLKQIGRAFQKYDDAQGHLPAEIQDKDGQPLLSWRVALLPYLGQEALYKQFALDQPWDSEHNLKLLAKMPAIYRVGIEPKEGTHTYYQVFVGPGTPFGPSRFLPSGDGSGATGGAAAPGGSGPPGLAGGAASSPQAPPKNAVSKRFVPAMMIQILDGTSNTLGVVEAGPPVPWSKPADLPFNPEKPLPKLKGPFANAFHVATLDGATYALRRDIDSTVLRNLIGMDDGNATPDFKTLRASQPVETPEERAALKEQIKRNQKLIEEYERLQKENVELLGKKNAEASELIQVEEQGEKLKELIEGVKARNKNLQSVPETPGVQPKPALTKPSE